jgi:tRNA modification GTPase
MEIAPTPPAARRERPSYGGDDPIAAFATPLGESALTLIRCSGQKSLELASLVFSRPQKLREAPPNSIIHGWIVEPPGAGPGGEAAEKIDEVLAAVYRAPKSYTGEDSLDISCHGGFAAGQGVMRALHAAGFRDALPGEFTFRAFMNGKLDLTRAESVMEVVSAKSDAGRRRAIGRLSGALEEEIRRVKTLLVEVLAGTELFLDYSDDEFEVPGAEARGLLPEACKAAEALDRLEKLGASWSLEQLCREGALAVIAGRPNAGKSSLFNLLLREERSIVTEIPGTTRDWIEGWLSLAGFPLRLVDTAGLRDAGAGPEADRAEKIGIERSRELIEKADLLLYVIDGVAGFTEEDRAFLREYGASPGEPGRLLSEGAGETFVPPPRQAILIWNKTDLAPVPLGAAAPGGNLLGVSAKTGQGLAELVRSIRPVLGAIRGGGLEGPGLETGIGTSRQKDCIDGALAAVKEALSLSARGEALDLIAPLLREAVNALGEITGEVSTAEILETMFSRFCVGK